MYPPPPKKTPLKFHVNCSVLLCLTCVTYYKTISNSSSWCVSCFLVASTSAIFSLIYNNRWH